MYGGQELGQMLLVLYSHLLVASARHYGGRWVGWLVVPAPISNLSSSYPCQSAMLLLVSSIGILLLSLSVNLCSLQLHLWLGHLFSLHLTVTLYLAVSTS